MRGDKIDKGHTNRYNVLVFEAPKQVRFFGHVAIHLLQIFCYVLSPFIWFFCEINISISEYITYNK